jgi:hypothetical protein
MADQPARPDVRTAGVRVWSGPMLWIAAALAVGAIAVTIVVRVQDRSGHVPPTSMFAAAGIVMSLIAMVTVTAAAHGAGAPFRAAIAFGGGFAAIAVTKFGFGATALFQGNRQEEIQNVGGLTSGGVIVVIGLGVGLLYIAAVWFLAVSFRPAPPPDGPRWSSLAAIVVLGIIGAAFTAFFITSAAMQYIAFALTGLEAGAIALALFIATMLVAIAFNDTAKRARAIGKVSMYVTVAWIAIAFLLVFHFLWIVFLLAVVSLWPLRTVTPK